MLRQEIETRVAVARTNMLGKLAHLFAEIGRRGTQFDEMSNARNRGITQPIDGLAVVPKRWIRP
jgi:hypothetical protein